ncbi:MAG: hypothetical protein V7696_00800 [Halioglobus sp.]
MKPIVSVASLTLLLAASLGARAQDEAEVQRGPWVWGVAGGAVHQVETDLEDAEGAFSVNRGFLQLSTGYAWDRRNSVSLSVGWGSSNYDFDSQANIGGNSPWGRIEDYSISLPIRFSAAGDKADVIVVPSIRSNTEDGASLSDGQTEGIIAGAGWKFSDRLTLGPGFGWFSELGGGSTAFPIVVVDWKITDRLSLETGRGLAASQGPGLTLSYALNPHWKVSGLVRYENIRFAVDGDESVGELGEDRSIPLLVSLDYSPWPMTSASVFFGAEVNGRLSLEDEQARRIASSDYETAPVIGFSLRSRF